MDIGIQEILLISVLSLLILGPERLPAAIKTVALWIGRIKRSFNDIKTDIEREINADEIRQQIHNENIMHQLGESADQLKQTAETINQTVEQINQSSDELSHRANQIIDKPSDKS